MRSLLFAALVPLFAAATPALAGEITGRVTSPKGGGGAVVYVVHAAGQFAPPTKPAEMDQRKMSFVPYILPILVGTTVEFKNDDQVNHNVFTPDGEGYNLGTWGPGQSKAHLFDKAGVYTQLCSLHPEMEAYIVVAQNPYFAVAKEDGTFTIAGVPDGTYQLRAVGKGIKKKERSKDFPVTVAGKTETTLAY